MDLLNNWLVQVFIGNIAWITLCKIIKWLRIQLNSSVTKTYQPERKFTEQFINKQFKICFFLSSVLTISLIIMFVNELQKQFVALFIFLGIILFFCFLLMISAFEEALEHWND
jgi:hypothetical protein